MSCLPDPLLPPRRWWLALVLLLSLVVAVCPADADFYLAPTGRDDAPGTALDPFATLQGAQVALRQWRAAHPGGEAVTVWLQGGFYPLRKDPGNYRGRERECGGSGNLACVATRHGGARCGKAGRGA